MLEIKISPKLSILDKKIEEYCSIFPNFKDSLKTELIKIKYLIHTGILTHEFYDLFTIKNNFQLNMTLSLFRDDYINNFGFYLISEDFLEKSKKLFLNKKILEVGAGTGFLSSCLKKYGLDITATDKKIDCNPYGFSTYHTDILELDSVKFLKENKNQFDMIIMSWPDYNSNFANNILKHMSSGQILMYIGEDYGGCTANDNFFDSLEKYSILLEKETLEFKSSSFSWFGIHDRIKIYQKV